MSLTARQRKQLVWLFQGGISLKRLAIRYQVRLTTIEAVIRAALKEEGP